MIDILYRGKAINRNPYVNYRTNYANGDWVYGLVSRLNEHFTEMTNENGVTGIVVDRETVCMGTTICGVRYFEGDIVEAILSRDGERKGHAIVKFGEFDEGDENIFTGFYLEWQGEIYRYYRKSIKWWITERNLKIIGNKFDNPELLERGAK